MIRRLTTQKQTLGQIFFLIALFLSAQGISASHFHGPDLSHDEQHEVLSCELCHLSQKTDGAISTTVFFGSAYSTSPAPLCGKTSTPISSCATPFQPRAPPLS